MNTKKTAAILAVILVSLQVLALMPQGIDAADGNQGSASYNGVTVSYVDSSQEGYGIMTVSFDTDPDSDVFTIRIDGGSMSAPIGVDPGIFAVPGGLSVGDHSLQIVCGDDEWYLVLTVSGVIHATSVDIDLSSVSLTVGQTKTLRATILPVGAVEKDVEWKSSDPSVATVKNGVVKAISSGKAVITASVNDLSDTCSVSVSDPAPTPPSPTHTHTWDSGTVTKPATCTETGIMTYKCTTCGETRTEVIPALGTDHQWSEWTLVKAATEKDEGLKERVCQVCGEKESAAIPVIIVIHNDDGTTTRTEEEVDGTVVNTTTGAEDGSTKVDKVKEEVDADGTQTTTTSSEVIDKDGNEVYYKAEEAVQGSTVTDTDGNKVTESSSRTTEREGGRTTETSESTKDTVSTDGSRETETVSTETVTEPDGSSSAVTVTESTKTAADGKTESTKVTETVETDDECTISSKQTETKDRDGKVTSDKSVKAESVDGKVMSSAEIPQGSDKGEIVTIVETGSGGSSHTLTAEQVEQAVSIQDRVSDEISGDVEEQTKVIMVQSATPDASLTVSQDVVAAVAESGSALAMSSQAGSLTVSNEVLQNISDEGTITVFVSEADEKDMSDAQRRAVGDAAAVDVKIMAGDRSLGESLDGTVTITIKHTQETGKVAAAYFVDANGSKEKMENTRYDAERHEVSFESTHCSLYMVVDEDPESGSSGSSTVLYICIGAVAVAAVLITAVAVSRRH